MRDIDASVREADAQARREFDAMRSATKAVAAEATEAVESPPAVTPTDRRDTPGYEPEPADMPGDLPGDASSGAPAERACRHRRPQPPRSPGRPALAAAARHRRRGVRPARADALHPPAVPVAGTAARIAAPAQEAQVPPQ